MAEQDEIRELRERITALEAETCAYSALFTSLASSLGPAFLDVAAELAESVETNPQAGRALSQRMTEALRIIEQIRAGSYRKPKPGTIV